jgi:hypothetical protein
VDASGAALLPSILDVQTVSDNTDKLRHQSQQSHDALIQLRRDNVVIIRDAIPSSLRTKYRAATYLSRLMSLPSTMDLLRPDDAAALHSGRARTTMKLTWDMLRRDGHDARTTHIVASNGITGYGALCDALLEAAAYIAPILDVIYKGWYGTHAQPHLDSIEMSIQAPLLPS